MTAGRDRWKVSRKAINLFTCGLAFLLGLIFCTTAGLYWLDIVDHFINNFGLVLIGLFECLAIGYVFGAKKMRDYINSVSEIKLGVWWDWLIKVIVPIILIITVVMSTVKLLRVPYENYPQWALLIGGWGVALLILALALMANRRWLPLSILLCIVCLIALGAGQLELVAEVLSEIGRLPDESQADELREELVGLLDRHSSVPLDKLDEEVDKWCEELLAKSPSCLKILKATFRSVYDPLRKASRRNWVQEFAPDFFRTGEADEGKNAFLERREPNYGQYPRTAGLYKVKEG